ncbi:nitrite reductase [Photobacterium galatheae]|uniref:Nitrite reductase n=1 Tax=Photobacterium galatheae TaxID=1654360 RepID=A0A066RHC3_9GAMM|nr:nitrite reductase [Photobacterium galatheae]
MSSGCRQQAGIQSACPYCGVGCGVRVQHRYQSGNLKTTTDVVGDPSHPANLGDLCVKGAALKESLSIPKRLLYPRVHGQEVSWAQATGVIAEKLKQTVAEHGPDSVAMYVSGQLLTEDYYVANKLMKGFIGTANLDTNSRLCMSSAVAAHNRAFGEDLVPVHYEDIGKAGLIVIVGANTAWTHPVLFRRIQQARAANPDVRLVVIDPRRTTTAEQADLHLPVANDGDVLLFHSLLRHLMDHQALDQTFINAYCQGFEALAQEVRHEKYRLMACADALDLNRESLHTFFTWFQETPETLTLFCQGINQSANGTDKANAIINCHLATGRIGKPGAGPFSLTGQPNAMGGREVGGLANQLAVHRGFDADSVREVGEFWQAPKMATQPGLKAVDLFDAMYDGKIKFVWVIATNPVVSLPDSCKVAEALSRCGCVVVSDISPDADTAAFADVLLPAAGWGEKDGMVTNSERMMSRQRAFLPPPGEAKADWRAICEVAQVMGFHGFDFASVADVYREYAALSGINRDAPYLFDISELASMSDEDYANWQPQRWPLGRSSHLFSDGRFPTARGRANFVLPASAEEAGDESSEHWWLNTGRQRDQWHTMTRTGHIARLAESETEPTVYMHPLSARKHQLEAGQLVCLKHAEQTLLAKLALDEGLSAKQLFMSMHWAGPFGFASRVNQMVAAVVDPVSGQPAFKSAAVSVSAADVASYGVWFGDQPPPFDTDFLSFQTGAPVHLWRFACKAPLSKAHLGDHSETMLILDDIGTGASRWAGLRMQGDKLKALCLVGEQPLSFDPQPYAALFDEAFSIQAFLTLTLQGQTPSKLVCSCFRVSDRQILKTIEQDGITSLSGLQAQLKCGTNCGSCLGEVQSLLKQQEADLPGPTAGALPVRASSVTEGEQV